MRTRRIFLIIGDETPLDFSTFGVIFLQLFVAQETFRYQQQNLRI